MHSGAGDIHMESVECLGLPAEQSNTVGVTVMHAIVAVSAAAQCKPYTSGMYQLSDIGVIVACSFCLI